MTSRVAQDFVLEWRTPLENGPLAVTHFVDSFCQALKCTLEVGEGERLPLHRFLNSLNLILHISPFQTCDFHVSNGRLHHTPAAGPAGVSSTSHLVLNGSSRSLLAQQQQQQQQQQQHHFQQQQQYPMQHTSSMYPHEMAQATNGHVGAMAIDGAGGGAGGVAGFVSKARLPRVPVGQWVMRVLPACVEHRINMMRHGGKEGRNQSWLAADSAAHSFIRRLNVARLRFLLTKGLDRSPV